MYKMAGVLRGTLLVLILFSSLTKAQSNPVKPSLTAVRINSDSEISLDGLLSEKVWLEAPIASDFTQNRPFDGGSPSERTEVRVLYSDKYLYVGIKAFDSSPDSITASLFRRDGSEVSDWVYVNIDSYNDNRTAFSFGVNPLGVQKDIMYFNDEEDDVLWDAVWDAEAKIVEDGWIVEYRIPLSQLRFTSTEEIQKWGINFEREIARLDELNFWSPKPREEFGFVSWFGDLDGVEDLSRPLRLEVLPYASAELTREPEINPNDPFYEENAYRFKIGGDIKYGITSDLTLTATINPDFGQVEADPATINLTAFETYFEERRPFFLEGSDIFSFGGTTSENSFKSHYNFYSRRIGKSPYGYASIAGLVNTYEDRPKETTIAGAAKISGKTKNGLSVGILNAYTLDEYAKYYNSGIDTEGKYLIEPSSNYFVGRATQDLNGGDSRFGAFLSTVNREDFSKSYLSDHLHKSAYQLGVDGQTFWNNRNWGASGVLSYSQVNGTENAIFRSQTSSARYYNRVDSDELAVDTSATSLKGYFGEFSIGKYSGPGLRYSFTYSEMSPGYEVNDIGFQERADYRAPHFFAEYFNVNPSFFRYYLLWGGANYAWNFDGDMIYNYYHTGGWFQFKNLWTMIVGAGITGTFYNDRIVRGGPVMRRPRDWNTSLEITSNSTRDFYTKMGGAYRRDASGEHSTTIYTSFNYRPTSFIQLQLSPTYINEKNTDQYQGEGDYDSDPDIDYLFSDSYLDIFYTEFRLDWTFTSKISLQTYIRPLLYTADFSGFKTFEERKTYNFNDLSQAQEDAYDPVLDFNYKTVQGNAVLRWEYRPGSTIYLVWQQERENMLYKNHNFRPFEGTRDIFKEDPINIFLIKFSYWFGS